MSLYKDASLVMIPSAYKDGKLYSIRPTDGSGDFTFSRGSNLAATRVDVNGLIEKGRENLYTQSNNFSHSDWNVKAGTFTQGVADPDGGNNAWSWTATNTDPYLYQSGKSLSGVGTLSIWVKGVGSTIGKNFELRNASAPYKNVVLTGDWQRVEHFNNTASGTSVGFEYGNPAVVGDVVHIYQAQLEQGLVATDYIETGTSAAQSGILEDMPRLDYSGSCPALLLEPQRTNFVTDSEYFAGLNLYGAINATYGAYTNPSGQDSAYLLEATSAISRIQTLSSTGDGNSAVMSLFIKGNSNVSYPTLANQGGGQYTRWEFDANNVLTYYDGDAPTGDYGQEDYGNGWYRIWLKTDTINGSTNYYRFNPDNRYGVGSLYAWGFQVEKNSSYPTSYIPTYGTSQTRSGDSCFLQNADVHSSGAGTIFFETGAYDTNTAASGFNKILWTGDEVGITNVIYFEEYVGNNTILIRKGGSTLLQSTPSYQDLGSSKIAIKWSSEEAKIFINGVLNNTYTGDASNTFEYFGYDNPYNGQIESTLKIKQRVHFDTALTDSECIALTTL